jgi:hypothetical protein
MDLCGWEECINFAEAPRTDWRSERAKPSEPAGGRTFSPVQKTRRSGSEGGPRLAQLTYAATWTLISFALASSRSGSRTVSTPALYSALTLAVSTVGGSANVRANEP